METMVTFDACKDRERRKKGDNKRYGEKEISILFNLPPASLHPLFLVSIGIYYYADDDNDG